MRLQLIGAILRSTVAMAEDSVEGRVDVYDDPWITVVMPTAGASTEQATATVDGSLGLDAVSGATPTLVADSISSATHFNDVRASGSLRVRAHPETDWSAGADVSASVESDYESLQLGVGGATDLFDRRATASVRIGGGGFQAGRAGDDRVAIRGGSGQLDADVVVVVDRSTTVTALLTVRAERCTDVHGCDASPYRYVAFTHDGGAPFALRERHPAARARFAGAVRWSRLFGDRTALHASYRGYGDDWGVIGHTEAVAVARASADEQWFVRAEIRAVQQGPARFAAPTYEVLPGATDAAGYRTGDPELSGFSEAAFELATRWSAFPSRGAERLSVNLRVASMYFVYPRFPERPRRLAILVGGGLGAVF